MPDVKERFYAGGPPPRPHQPPPHRQGLRLRREGRKPLHRLRVHPRRDPGRAHRQGRLPRTALRRARGDGHPDGRGLHLLPRARRAPPRHQAGQRAHPPRWRREGHRLRRVALSGTGPAPDPGGASFSARPTTWRPEYFTGGEITFKVDIYAFGVVLYCMVAGRLPFEGSSDMEVFAKHVSEHARPLNELRPRLPPPCCRASWNAASKRIWTIATPTSPACSRTFGSSIPRPDRRPRTSPATRSPPLPPAPSTPPPRRSKRAAPWTPPAVSKPTRPGPSPSPRPPRPSIRPRPRLPWRHPSPSLARRVSRNLAKTSSRDLKWAFLSAAAILLALALLLLSLFGGGPSVDALRVEWSAEKGARVLLGELRPRRRASSAWTTDRVRRVISWTAEGGRRDEARGLPAPPDGGTKLSLPGSRRGETDGPTPSGWGTLPELLDFRVEGEIEAPEISWTSSRALRFEVLRSDGPSPPPPPGGRRAPP